MSGCFQAINTGGNDTAFAFRELLKGAAKEAFLTGISVPLICSKQFLGVNAALEGGGLIIVHYERNTGRIAEDLNVNHAAGIIVAKALNVLHNLFHGSPCPVALLIILGRSGEAVLFKERLVVVAEVGARPRRTDGVYKVNIAVDSGCGKH